MSVDTVNLGVAVNGNSVTFGNNSGIIQPWQTGNNSGLSARDSHASVIANGYMYIIGGLNGATPQATVQYAKINANGNVGNWTTTTALPANRVGASAVYANGYIYVTGGSTDNTAANAQDTIYYAKVNPDGTINNWNTSANPVNFGGSIKRWGHQSVAYNGYLYFVSGYNTSGTGSFTVYYSKLNSDGSNGTWAITSPLAHNHGDFSIAVANGYIYALGGAPANFNEYAKINTNGTVASWADTTAFPVSRTAPGVAVVNGYLYVIGGSNNGSTYYASTLYAPLNSDGTIGSWSCQGSASDCSGSTQVNTTALPATRAYSGSTPLSANGYLYAIGGTNGSSASTVYYSSTSRVQVNGSLDLVGASGENLNEGGSGGRLTAGNTDIIGQLNVNGSGSISQGLSVADSLSVGGTAQFRNNSAASTSFQVQNASGISNMLVTTVNLLTNTTFESNANGQTPDGWTTIGTNSTITADNTQAQYGTNSLKDVTSTNTNAGAKSLYSLIASTQYTLSFYGKVSSSTITDIQAGRADDGSTNTNCFGGGQTFTTTWTRFSCTFTTGSTISGSPYFYIYKTGGSAETFYIDGVQLEAAAAATTYREADIKFDGQITFKNSADSATAFQVQTASAASLFTADTVNRRIIIGTGSTGTTGSNVTILVLDNKTDSGDPTGVNGAMYYNANSHSFRCYTDGAWMSCGALVSANTSVPGGNTVANTTTETNFASNYSLPANYCQPGRVIKITAQGIYSSTGSPQLNIRVKLGSTVLATSQNMNPGAVSSHSWITYFQIICDTTGVSGTVEGQGVTTIFTGGASDSDNEMQNTGTITVDTTTAQTVQMSSQWTVANAGNTITLRQLIIEGLGP
jgi:hypothetical protein